MTSYEDEDESTGLPSQYLLGKFRLRSEVVSIKGKGYDIVNKQKYIDTSEVNYMKTFRKYSKSFCLHTRVLSRMTKSNVILRGLDNFTRPESKN